MLNLILLMSPFKELSIVWIFETNAAVMNKCFWSPFGIFQKLHLTQYIIQNSKSRSRTLFLNSCSRNKIGKEFNSKNKADYERAFNPLREEQNIKNRNTLYYATALTVLVGGCTYLSVLLYRLYCQTTGKGGQAVIDELGEKVSSMKPVKNRNITVNFNADINSSIMWNFKPQQPYITVVPGETALAFYTAMNPTDKAVAGVATYNVLPFEAGKYFNKIQCFCFEEQQLNPKEEVDMPVFFYLDPEYAEDPFLENINNIVLSYTFFEAKEGMHLPMPSFT